MILGTLVIGGFVLLMLLGVPVTMAIGASAIAGLYYAGFGEMALVVPQQILDGAAKPALLAIPFFILAGNLMNAVGLTDRIFNFCLAVVGHFRAGLAYVNVIASLLFAGVSGAATADIAGLGQLEVRAMRARGYKPEFAAALTVATSLVGPIVPPSISLIVYAWLANESVARLFLAGIVPGILVALSFILYIRVVSTWTPMPREPRATFRQFGTAALEGIPALVAPGIILGAIIFGFATATEAGVIACGYSILIGLCYRSLSWKAAWDALAESAVLSALIMMIIGFSQIMGWLFAFEQVPQAFASGILETINQRWIFMSFTIVLLVLIGCFMEASPAKIILLPLLLPVADAFGIDRVQFGMVITLALLLGIATPPLGVGLYLMSAVSGVRFEKLAVAILPLMIPPIIVLILIAAFPQITLWLPDLVMGPR
ncbi:C4-dicarboxylate ABC transporter permease [Pacificitalea manganoxidans]|uniref:TRAP transporter large permease protein n=1 Tax=Pacificitalea manganoxidans TaxID=1411902 RepID=A0A291LXB5_9RHOB|nr:TRAP transporter large permease [Pacificitalea manganoxidans]ATI41148.1 C4-dicarboxylate ABC transporter permease [Pacificitalea manganoxidans]MAQ44766.1 TRAP transporter large permease [Actibacterium sp.]MDR6308522.1 tripartite ATP-independent transporter DctM subunit [Pacificitalea manganoxidans]OWU69314.1 C4-dicarboxylate ABC transporter permease [Roseovarius sp. 22II1-1F6A]